MSKYKSIIFFFLYNIKMKPITSNNNINAIKEGRKLFNELKSNFSRAKTDKNRKKLNKKEVVYNFLKEKEQESS